VVQVVVVVLVVVVVFVLLELMATLASSQVVSLGPFPRSRHVRRVGYTGSVELDCMQRIILLLHLLVGYDSNGIYGIGALHVCVRLCAQ